MAREDDIRVIAYNIWQEEGCCDGQDVEHWLRAEVIWEQEYANSPATKAAKAPARSSKSASKAKQPKKKS